MDSLKITPTAAELEILNILWENEPLSVKEIHDQLASTKNVGYTTTLKIMQNMTSKGLLSRELNGKSHLYTALIKKDTTQRTLLNRMVDTVFGGSASSLVMQILGNKNTTPEELDEIKRIISDMEENQ